MDWQEKLHELWQRKFAGALPVDARERAKQGRFLSYRGYPLEMIGRLLSGRGGMTDISGRLLWRPSLN